MLLVTLGTVEYPFQRPISWIKTLVERGELTESMFIQYGSTAVGELSRSPLVQSASLIPQVELIQLAKQARLVITHGGDGSVRLFSRLGVRFVVVPRLSAYGEHTDNHQLQLLDSFGLAKNHACLAFEDLQRHLQSPPEASFNNKFSDVPRLSKHLEAAYPGRKQLQLR